MPETNFFWDPLSDNILQERDETGAVTADYTTEPGLYGNVISQNRDGAVGQLHFDAIGSTLTVTDDDQQVTDTRAYTAFGDTTEETGVTDYPSRYIGQKGYYSDRRESLLVRLRAYNPVIGRWLSRDPIPFNDGPNPYEYTRNSPLILIDPAGTLTIDPAKGQRLAGSCDGAAPQMSWDFLLDARFGRTFGAPCTGWLIQKVDVYCFRGPCEKDLTRSRRAATRDVCCCDRTSTIVEFTYY